MTIAGEVKHFLKHNLGCQNVTDNMLLKANLKLDDLDVCELIHAIECQFGIFLPDSIGKDFAKGLDFTVAELIQKIENGATKNLAKTVNVQPQNKLQSVKDFYQRIVGRFAQKTN